MPQEDGTRFVVSYGFHIDKWMLDNMNVERHVGKFLTDMIRVVTGTVYCKIQRATRIRLAILEEEWWKDGSSEDSCQERRCPYCGGTGKYESTEFYRTGKAQDSEQGGEQEQR